MEKPAVSLPKPTFEGFKTNLELLKSTIKKIASHNDADGVSSAALFRSMVPDAQIEIQRKFSNYSPGTDLMLDMVPPTEYDKYCIDHHPHPPEHPYTLLHEKNPTGLIIWNNFKQFIPKEEWWKVAVSCVGDGQQYSIPPEVFKENNILLNRIPSFYPQRTGELRIYQNPVWLLISSPINALSKIRQERLAFEVLSAVKSPLDLINNPSVLEAKAKLRAEIAKWLSDGIYERIGEVIVGRVDSELVLQKDIAIKIETKEHLTALIMNERSKEGSIRGVLSTWLKGLFADGKLLEIGGHKGFMGAELVGSMDEVAERIRRNKI